MAAAMPEMMGEDIHDTTIGMTPREHKRKVGAANGTHLMHGFGTF